LRATSIVAVSPNFFNSSCGKIRMHASIMKQYKKTAIKTLQIKERGKFLLGFFISEPMFAICTNPR
jgi:hypothetical protein